MITKYTREAILADAARFTVKRDWKQQSYRFYKAARLFGADFYAQCMRHMKRAKRLVGPTKGKFRYTDAEIERVAKDYRQRNHFKRGARPYYQAALTRYGGSQSDFFTCITAHMDAPSNPYSDSVYAYVVEFDDRHAYVGISGRVEGRRWEDHQRRGPVARHLKKQPDVGVKFTILERGLNAASAKAREAYWQADYLDKEWTPLWKIKTPAGSLGSVPTVTREQCRACAALCRTRKEFFDRYQSRYRISKRNGWYEEITRHMPTDLEARQAQARKNSSRPVSDATRQKQRLAKLGKKKPSILSAL
jgi:predicted GIY-YIG superfamily endonuclease